MFVFFKKYSYVRLIKIVFSNLKLKSDWSTFAKKLNTITKLIKESFLKITFLLQKKRMNFLQQIAFRIKVGENPTSGLKHHLTFQDIFFTCFDLQIEAVL